MSEAKFCENCGAALAAGARFCEACGHKIGETPASTPAAPSTPAPANTNSHLSCPKCGQSDMAFLASDFMKRKFSEEEVDAAQRADQPDPEAAQIFLEKPEKPDSPDITKWLAIPLIPVVNFLFCWFAPMHKGYKFFMLGIVIVFWVCVFVPELYASSAYAFVGCFFLLFYYSALFIDRDRQKVEWTTHHLPQYNKAVARWEHLSYCQRCDVVWLDNEPGRLAEVEDTEKLLNA